MTSMHKIFQFTLFSILFSLPIFSFAQEKNSKVSLRVRVSDSCKIDSMRIFAWTGIQAEPFMIEGLSYKKSGAEFDFKLEDVPHGNYYIGTNLKNMQPFLIGEESKMIMNANNCLDARTYEFEKSDLNIAFNSLLDSIRSQSSQFFSLISSYQQNLNNAEVLKDLDKKLADVDYRRRALLNKLKDEHPILGKIAALYTYMSFQNNKKDGQAEGDYLAQNYFQFVEMNDEAYNRLPFFFEAIKSYSTNMTRVGLNANAMAKYFDKILADVGKEQAHHQSALLGVAFGLVSSKNHQQLFLKYARMYQELYNGQNKELDKFLALQIVKVRGVAPVGEEAPNFTAQTPEGKDLSLKDLRGKVLLVDFWASWCGPCRRENPNVVRVYNKYKDKGFDILGVSLDTKKDRWLGAIAKDGLTWNHVSDLKGWSSDPAKMYGVRGIPFTILLDKDGKVIAKNLRGPQLEAKLEEIFGE
jgi:thiol-disulfide isomerase/thioredoxin/predicted secreted protein